MNKTDDELIAEFMGYKQSDGEDGVYHKGQWYDPIECERRVIIHYSNAWDYLMPVVQKIERLYSEAFPSDFIEKLLLKEPTIDYHYMDVIALPLATKIEDAHAAVVEFIKWYNSNKSHE